MMSADKIDLPAPRKPYTLLISFEDVLVCKAGDFYKVRPYTAEFLTKMSDEFEILLLCE